MEKTEKQIEVSGEWMNSLWKNRPLKVYAELDAVAAFLNQDSLPYLWPDEPKY